jgi:N-acetylglutamate synthase-like GNAT family acetyltransferase
VKIAKARVQLLSEINALIAASKSHWDYPLEYLQQALPLLAINADYLEKNLAFEILNSSGNIEGFFAVSNTKGEWHLDHLWISPACFGQGYGRTACEYLFKLGEEQSWQELFVLPDPFAEGFYKKVGFMNTGIRVPSRVPMGPTFSIFKIDFDRPGRSIL